MAYSIYAELKPAALPYIEAESNGLTLIREFFEESYRQEPSKNEDGSEYLFFYDKPRGDQSRGSGADIPVQPSLHATGAVGLP